VSKITSLSEQEQAKLVSLTDEQFKSLQASDEHEKQNFLKKEPDGIDSSLKNHDTVKKMLSNWGK